MTTSQRNCIIIIFNFYGPVNIFVRNRLEYFQLNISNSIIIVLPQMGIDVIMAYLRYSRTVLFRNDLQILFCYHKSTIVWAQRSLKL